MSNNLDKIQKYWTDRISKLKNAQYDEVENIESELKKLYTETNKHIKNDMFIFYSKYSDNQGITLESAQKLLKEEELKEWKISLEKYKELAQDKANKRYLNEMYLRSRVSRLDALEAQIQAEIRLLGENQEGITQNILEDVYENTYQDTIKAISEFNGISIRYDKFDKKELESIVKKPFQNSNFSSRIWDDKANLIEQLKTTLAQHIVMGKSPSQLAEIFSKKMCTSYYKASRLLNTEAANITEQATLQSYKDTNIDEYEILAVLDERTSEICQNMNGKRFKISEAKTGINYPPFHPNCRTTTVPVTRLDMLFNLTPKEEHAINQYISSDSYKINEKLRNGTKLNKTEKKLCDNLDSALKKAPRYTGNLTRSLQFYNDDDLNEFLDKHQVGKIVEYPAYTSTTYANRYNDTSNVEIHIMNSKNGADISMMNLEESEVLYRRNSKFIITRITKEENLWHIYMEEDL